MRLSFSTGWITMSDVWRRLRERRFVQWMLAYLAGAWLLLQVVHLLGEQFSIAPGLLRSTTAVLGVGVLAALVVSWYHGEQGRQRITTPELLMLAGILVIAGAAVAMVREEPLLPPVAASTTAGPAELQPFPVARDRSIAVLPFANLSDDRDNEHFSDGLTEELMMDLTQMTTLRVISRTSVMRYKESDLGVREIGDELGVAHVVTGSVRRFGQRLRITAQLVDARTDQHVWAESYDSHLDDIFDIQRRISSQIAASLRAAIPAVAAAAPGAPTSNSAAYQLYLEGRYNFHNRHGSGARDRLLRSAEQLRGAVAADPGFARAWAALGVTYAAMSGVWGQSEDSLTSAVATDRARQAAGRALELDPGLADAYVANGMVQARLLHWAAAEQSFRQALIAEPQNATAHDWYGSLLVTAGRNQEAERILRRSAELDPVNARTLHWLADALRNSGRMDESRLQAQRSVELGMFGSSVGVYIYHLRRSDWEEAVAYQESAARLHGIDPGWVRPLVNAIRDPAMIPQAVAAGRAAGNVSSYMIGMLPSLYFDLADEKLIFEGIEGMIRDGEGFYALWRIWEPEFTRLRNHPRFRAIAQRIGLVDYWREYGWPDLCRPEGDSFTCR
jgi:TolB-like protein/cytochrome c-type biogenesis protein CcmH/NrfG